MASHSKLAVVKVDNSSGALTDISTYCNQFDIKRKLDQKDVTTFGATSRAWLAGFADADVDLGGPWSRASDNFWSPIIAGFEDGTITSISFEYGPEGADTGDVKYTGELVMSDAPTPMAKVDDPVEWKGSFKVTGGVTVSAY